MRNLRARIFHNGIVNREKAHSRGSWKEVVFFILNLVIRQSELFEYE